MKNIAHVVVHILDVPNSSSAELNIITCIINIVCHFCCVVRWKSLKSPWALVQKINKQINKEEEEENHLHYTIYLPMKKNSKKL